MLHQGQPLLQDADGLRDDVQLVNNTLKLSRSVVRDIALLQRDCARRRGALRLRDICAAGGHPV